MTSVLCRSHTHIYIYIIMREGSFGKLQKKMMGRFGESVCSINS